MCSMKNTATDMPTLETLPKMPMQEVIDYLDYMLSYQTLDPVYVEYYLRRQTSSRPLRRLEKLVYITSCAAMAAGSIISFVKKPSIGRFAAACGGVATSLLLFELRIPKVRDIQRVQWKLTFDTLRGRAPFDTMHELFRQDLLKLRDYLIEQTGPLGKEVLELTIGLTKVYEFHKGSKNATATEEGQRDIYDVAKRFSTRSEEHREYLNSENWEDVTMVMLMLDSLQHELRT